MRGGHNAEEKKNKDLKTSIQSLFLPPRVRACGPVASFFWLIFGDSAGNSILKACHVYEKKKRGFTDEQTLQRRHELVSVPLPRFLTVSIQAQKQTMNNLKL